MFGSTILDVAIGLVFIYFTLSLIVSQANDLIARMLQWRSKTLEEGVRKMLLDNRIADRVWMHPLVAGTSFKPPENIPSGTFVVALIDAIVPPSEGGAAPAVQAMRSQVDKLPDGHVKNQLTHIINSANGNMAQFRAGIENWFNASMDRVSAEYKKRMQLLTLGIALSISLILGVDTISVANGLWREPVMRSALAESIQQTGVLSTAIPSARTTNTQDMLKQLGQYNLPMGWSNLPQDWMGWLSKIFGLVITTLAVSLGAPFWFDLLRSLSNLRNATGPTRLPAPSPSVGAFPTTLKPANGEASKIIST